jgi:hypothetical protein
MRKSSEQYKIQVTSLKSAACCGAHTFYLPCVAGIQARLTLVLLVLVHLFESLGEVSQNVTSTRKGCTNVNGKISKWWDSR